MREKIHFALQFLAKSLSTKAFCVYDCKLGQKPCSVFQPEEYSNVQPALYILVVKDGLYRSVNGSSVPSWSFKAVSHNANDDINKAVTVKL